ncbi:MAG: hypothetical protein ACTSYD_01090 [Candidatus Heimdallarchaeaceae archaeon]
MIKDKKLEIIPLALILVFCLIFVSFISIETTSIALNNQFIGNKDLSKAMFSQKTSNFQILSPQNGTSWSSPPMFTYSVSGELEKLTLWLNGTQYSNMVNNTQLPVCYRGEYNLTVSALVDTRQFITYILFKYNPSINITIDYSAKFVNKHFKPVNYTDPMPVYSYNETVCFYAFSNEANQTLNLEIFYGDYFGENYPLEKLEKQANYTWINSTCLKIYIQPLSVNFTYHKLLFVTHSGFDSSNMNLTFVFNRVYTCSIKIYPSEYQDFLDTPLHGYISCRFMIYIEMIPATNISVYLDHHLIKEMYYPEGSYFPESYFSIEIDTTNYENGIHTLEIYGKDLFNFTVFYQYTLTFANPTHISDNLDTQSTTFPYLFSIIAPFCICFCIILKRKSRKHF